MLRVIVSTDLQLPPRCWQKVGRAIVLYLAQPRAPSTAIFELSEASWQASMNAFTLTLLPTEHFTVICDALTE